MVVTYIIHKAYELLNYLEETFDSGFQADQAIMVFVLYSNYVWHGWSLRIHAQDAKSSEEEKDDLYRSGVKRWSWSLMDRHGFKCCFHHFLAFSIYHTPSCAVMCWIVSPTSNICMLIFQLQGLPWWLRQVRICLQCRKPRFEPRRPHGEGNGNPLQYSCLENSMDTGGWWVSQSLELQRVGHDWTTYTFPFLSNS